MEKDLESAKYYRAVRNLWISELHFFLHSSTGLTEASTVSVPDLLEFLLLLLYVAYKIQQLVYLKIEFPIFQ